MAFTLLAGWSHSPWIVFWALIGAIIIKNIRDPHFSHLLNARIESRSRATTLSNLNLLKGILDIPILLIAGYLASIQLEYVLFFAAGISAFAIIFLRVGEKDFQIKKLNIA